MALTAHDDDDDDDDDVTNQKNIEGNAKIVVAMVCNFGHVDLLLNFVCSARSRNLDLSQVLVFALDTRTAGLARSLGLNVFDVGTAFGEMPDEVSVGFGDDVFKKVVVAKFYAAHLLNQLGYDCLLQDADVVWYPNPLNFFARQQSSDSAGVLFVDDGSRWWFYGPWSANTGFFFVRHNDHTENFLKVLVRHGDLVHTTQDQEAMAVLLSEHVSLGGLRVKVLGRDTPEGMLFPTGFHYRERSEFMREFIVNGTHAPYVFHMSWTANKDEKKLFFEQLGDWYVRQECIGRTVGELDLLHKIGRKGRL